MFTGPFDVFAQTTRNSKQTNCTEVLGEICAAGDWQVVSYATILWTADGLWRHPPIFVAMAAPGKLDQKLNRGLVCFVSSKFRVKKNQLILSFFFQRTFLKHLFCDFPYNQWKSQSNFFSYWWFLMIFCVSQVSQILGSGASAIGGKMPRLLPCLAIWRSPM